MGSKRERIVLRRGPTGWLARFIGGEFDGEEVPTPFTVRAPVWDVVDAIVDRNPGVDVEAPGFRMDGREAPDA